MVKQRVVDGLVADLKEYGPQPLVMVKWAILSGHKQRANAETILDDLVRKRVICKTRVMWGEGDKRKMTECYGVRGHLKKIPWRERDKARVEAMEKALQDIGKLTCSCSDRWKPGIHYSYCAPAMARAVLAGKGSQ